MFAPSTLPSTSPRSDSNLTRHAEDARSLKVDHLTKCYDGNTVVDDLTFVVPPGESPAFSGRTVRARRRRSSQRGDVLP
ncbi:MAG: hypothetical protein KAZ69_17960, partial [Candidatus Microthrix sp.]